MKNRRKKGVRSTKNIVTSIGDKSISNSDTGTKDSSTERISNRLDAKGKANLAIVKSFMASKSRFVKAEEFADKGLIIEILAVEKIKKGKFGETLQVKLLDVKENKERLWGITGQRAGAAVMSMMAKGIKRMVIWTKGRGMNTQYFAKPVGTRDMALRPIQDGIRSKDHIRQKHKVKSTGGRKAKH